MYETKIFLIQKKLLYLSKLTIFFFIFFVFLELIIK
jgi:hypothetical protein